MKKTLIVLILGWALLLAAGCEPCFRDGVRVRGEECAPFTCDEYRCDDPDYPVICGVERPEGLVWTCAVDAATCEGIPGVVCE